MTSIVARQFIVSRLSDDRLRKLHAIENKNGVEFTPSEIWRRGKLSATGEVPEDFQERVAPIITAIYYETRKNVFDDAERENSEPKFLDIIHQTDLVVRKREIDLDYKSEKRSSGVYNRVKNYADAAGQDVPTKDPSGSIHF